MGSKTFLSPQKELLLPKSGLPLLRQPLCNFCHHQFSSVAQSRPTLCDPMDCSTPGFPVHYQLPELAQTQVHWAGDAIQPSHPLSSPSPPTFNLSQHQVLFQWVLYIRWPNHWSFSFSISPSNEYSGLVSFRMDWLDLLAVQGILNSLLQHHSSKASILWCSAFFIVQLSHPYMTTEKTMALTRWTFVGKVMSLLFNGFPGGSDGKKSICLQCGRPGFNPWVGKILGEGNGNPLQYSCLENPKDGGAW